MRRIWLVGWLSLGLAASVAAAEKPKGDTDRWYLGKQRGKNIGYFHITRSQSGKKLAPVKFAYEFAAKWRDKIVSCKVELLCKDDLYFSPVRITCEGKGDDEFKNFAATVDWLKTDMGKVGTLRALVDGRWRTRTLPEGTVDQFLLFDIVCRQPFDKNTTFGFHPLETHELNAKRDNTLHYVGVEEINVGKKAVKTHRFDQRARNRTRIKYWVTEKRDLARVLIDDEKDFILTTEAEAKKALK